MTGSTRSKCYLMSSSLRIDLAEKPPNIGQVTEQGAILLVIKSTIESFNAKGSFTWSIYIVSMDLDMNKRIRSEVRVGDDDLPSIIRQFDLNQSKLLYSQP